MIKFRASQLFNIMTDPKEKDQELSVGAKTYLEKLAKIYVYDFNEVITGKYMDKGLIVEDQSIALMNEVYFTNYTKNTERKSNDWITGECDIVAPTEILDVKSSWSLKTFPVTRETATKQSKEAGYDWQKRAYMWLWGMEQARDIYCMVDTPDELIKYEDPNEHYVSHLNPALRVTETLPYVRDVKLEDKIKYKVDAARKHLEKLVKIINEEHCV